MSIKDKFFRNILSLSLLIILFSCSPAKKISVTSQQLVDYNAKIKKADNLFNEGSYLSLKEAFKIYDGILSFPAFQQRIRVKLIKSVILLALRENELGILNDRYYSYASNLIQNAPYLAEFDEYLNIARFASRDGFKDAYSIDGCMDWTKNSIEPLNAQLKERSDTEDFFAYLYISLNSDFSYFIREKNDFSRYQKVFIDSPMIQFKLAIYPKWSNMRLEEIIMKQPQFYEAYYFLGEIALMLGKLVTAEQNLLKAYEQIPESTAIILRFSRKRVSVKKFYTRKNIYQFLSSMPSSN